MKKKLLLSTLLVSGITFAQIGVGNELPHESSILHIGDDINNNRGLLIPNIALKSLADKTVIENDNPKEGLIIFNTSELEGEGISKGFYYWGTTRKENGIAIFEWNKLISTNELQIGSITDNHLEVELFSANINNETTQGFKLKKGATEIGEFKEALTKFIVENREMHVLHKIIPQDGNAGSQEEPVEGELVIYIPATNDENAIAKEKIPAGYKYIETLPVESLVYTDELGVEKLFTLKAIMSSSETLTSLQLVNDFHNEKGESLGPALVYSDEKNVVNVIFLSKLLENVETLTSLTFDPNLDELIYTDELGIKNHIAVSSLNKSAWYKVDGSGSGSFGDNIYTEGWVAIGFEDLPERKIDEKLRVNGAISAVMGWYADYVFDAYYNGTSALKYDYNFKNLDSVDEFIKVNKHLPGITPISELNTTENGYEFNMSELSIQLLEKTEELFLHTIEQAKDIKALQKENEEFKSRIQVIEEYLKEKMSK